MTYFNLSGPAGDQSEYQHAGRDADSEGAEAAMTDEEELGEEEQPTARPRLKYGEGLKRIWVVLSVCWVGFWLIFPVAAIVQEGLTYRGLTLVTILEEALRHGNFGVGFLAILVIPPALGYVFLLRVIPWIIAGFRNEQ